MHITSTRGHSKVAQNGVEYEPVQGFVFELPDDLALHLLDIHDQYGPLWRLSEQDDYDLDEELVPPPIDLGSAAETAPKDAPKQSKRPSKDGTPPVTGQ